MGAKRIERRRRRITGAPATSGGEVRRIWLERVLPKRGICSRTQARELIRQGGVTVDGRVVRDPKHEVDAATAAIAVRGRPSTVSPPLYLMLNKPVGCVTTARDERGRRTIFDLLDPALPYLFAVGRLDMDSSGLLLLTNDSRFAERIADPRHHVPKTYRVLTGSILDEAQIASLRAGVMLKDGLTRPARVRRLGEDRGGSVLSVTLTEGRNRQIRRMLEAVGDCVVTLERTAIGPLLLGALSPGAVRSLSPAEVARLEEASR